MKPIRTIAIDDEYLALELLTDYCRQAPDVELVATFSSAAAALEIIRQEPPQLLLLDVQMPGLSGLNLLRTLRSPPVTVFTTAYDHHAVEAFDLDAVDYLLKPFSFERFLRAVAKVRERLAVRSTTMDSEEPAFIIARVDGRLVRISCAEILYIEGLKEYVRIHTDQGRYVTLERLKNLEALLPRRDFLRIHKSYLIARRAVRALEGHQLEVAGKLLPISRGKREEIVRELFPNG